MNKPITIDDFSQHLFWDVDKGTFDLNKYKIQMISKVLEYGNWNNWKLLRKYYVLETIKEVSLNLRSLDAVTLSYLAALFSIKKILDVTKTDS
jgi:hypothetical protein